MVGFRAMRFSPMRAKDKQMRAEDDARRKGESGVRQNYNNQAVDDANAQGYANWAARDYESKYGDTGNAGTSFGGDINSSQYTGNKKAKRLFSDLDTNSQTHSLISA